MKTFRHTMVSIAVAALALAVGAATGQTTPADMAAKLVKEVDASKANAKAKAFAKDKLIPLCANKVFAKEVAAQNAKKVALDEIKKIDKQWIDAEEELPIHVEKMGNACAKEIKSVIKANSAIVEAFVMDNQGAVVGENNLTSDYWQGDEGKWKNSYKEGKGGVDIGDAEFDKSANAVLQQISLPIVDAKGKVIGAVTYGVAIDKL